ncbi:transposase, partial [Clostridium sp.]|uniref:transposase n=1 Tax=Clostridium sp. TaxID=1506 RepID=UPI001B725A9E
MKKITKARTCVYNVNYHIVWAVKYRHKILNSLIENRIKEIFNEISIDKGFIIHEIKVGECDHI